MARFGTSRNDIMDAIKVHSVGAALGICSRTKWER
jgi:hypothetical protein